MKTADWLSNATNSLKEVGIPSARLDAHLLACHVVNCTRTWLLAHPEYDIPGDKLKELTQLLDQRLQFIPLAYLFGEKEFYGRTFLVNNQVLVPRPESEDLISLALELTDIRTVVDVGCGTGILGITLALEKPSWNITLSDIDAPVIALAQQNAWKFDLGPRITFKHQDLLRGDTQQYDLIIANLPYVPTSMEQKPDLRAEPTLALFAGADGLSLYRSFFSLFNQRANKPKHIITEALISQHVDLAELALAAGYTLKKTQGLAQHFTNA